MTDGPGSAYERRACGLTWPSRRSGRVWVNGNWRVTFRFIKTDVELVDYEDYH